MDTLSRTSAPRGTLPGPTSNTAVTANRAIAPPAPRPSLSLRGRCEPTLTTADASRAGQCFGVAVGRAVTRAFGLPGAVGVTVGGGVTPTGHVIGSVDVTAASDFLSSLLERSRLNDGPSTRSTEVSCRSSWTSL